AGGGPNVRRGDAVSLEHVELLHQREQIHHGAGPDEIDRVGIEDPGWDQMELEFTAIVDHGVSGVVAALEPDDEVRVLSEDVCDLAFAFVAPLRADDGGDGHVSEE